MSDKESGSGLFPAKLNGKALPNEKLFFVIAALEASNQFNNDFYKFASALSKQSFSPCALKGALSEWRFAAKDLLIRNGEEAKSAAKDLPMSLGGGLPKKDKEEKANGKRGEILKLEEPQLLIRTARADDAEEGGVSPKKKKAKSTKGGKKLNGATQEETAGVKVEDGEEE